jgi:hypothetical protein
MKQGLDAGDENAFPNRPMQSVVPECVDVQWWGPMAERDEEFSDEEKQRRFESLVKAALNTPPKHTVGATQSRSV